MPDISQNLYESSYYQVGISWRSYKTADNYKLVCAVIDRKIKLLPFGRNHCVTNTLVLRSVNNFN